MGLEVVNDILDFSKIEAGKMELNIEAMDLVGVLNQVPATFGAAAAEKHLDLQVMVPAGFPVSIEGDAMRLRQVVYNLVSNAIKFTLRATYSSACRSMRINTPSRWKTPGLA